MTSGGCVPRVASHQDACRMYGEETGLGRTRFFLCSSHIRSDRQILTASHKYLDFGTPYWRSAFR